MSNAGHGALGRPLPPAYFLAATALMIGLHQFVPVAQLIRDPWRWFGAVPFAAGLAFGTWAFVLFKRAGTTVKPFEPSQALVAAGPYAVSRNPMYVGLVLMLSGVALGLGSITPWLVLPFFIWRIRSRVIAVEERMLESTFGAAYLAYKANVRRWL